MKQLFLLLMLLTYSTLAFGQGAWPYHFGFALYDKSGHPITAYDVNLGKAKVFISQLRPTLSCNYGLNLFIGEGSTVYRGVTIGLIQERDTTIVHLSIGSERIILTNWPEEPGNYILNEWEHSASFVLSPNLKATGNENTLYSLTVLEWKKYKITSTPSTQQWPFTEQDALKVSGR